MEVICTENNAEKLQTEGFNIAKVGRGSNHFILYRISWEE